MAIFAVLLATFVETLARGSFLQAIGWAAQKPLPFFVASLSIFILTYAAGPAVGRLTLGSILVMIPLAGLAFAHAGKMLCLNEPLFPWDLLLMDDFGTIVSLKYFPYTMQQTIAFLALILTVIAAALLLPKLRISKIRRLVAFSLLAGVLATFFMGFAPIQRAFSGLFETYIWFPAEGYRQNGFCTAMLVNIQTSRLPKPDGYDSVAIDSIREKYGATGNAAKIPDDQIKPDIILVINESFWDPTLLPNVEYSQDPLANFHSLQKDNGSLMIYSPVFAGFSANAEFEIVTGMNIAFMPPGTVPYVHHITHPTPSTASILAEMGYDTTVLYATSGGLYRTRQVAQLLGFKHVYTTDEVTEMREQGLYVPDRVVMEQAIKLIDKQQSSPLFLMCVTIENHGPYDDQRFANVSSDIQIDGPLSEKSRELLDNYLVGIQDADKSLGMLVEFLQKRNRPTILLFLGDHLPGIGPDYLAYREGGLVAQYGPLGEEDRLKIHTVPALLWSNFSKPGVLENRSMPFIMPMLLQQANLPQPAFCTLLEKIRKDTPAIGYQTSEKANGQVPTAKADAMKEYELLQYDMIFGQQRAANLFSTPKILFDQSHRPHEVSAAAIKSNDTKAQ